ncbi:hypothetical protein OFO16_19025 [Vibrio natriegens]|uniref:hypothetical protein n=1 Tax=Vibrio natriegens TaxID=691 RepID=UPI0021E722FB|nr:hypothetical protein [Vibrio natriegens]UYI50086.1 hypothetical protein OFO16_19025 [Vibrio natriegens]
MQITKIAAAIAISTGLLAGCNTDLRDEPSTPTTPPPAETESALSEGMWEISAPVSAAASGDENDLPNVYVFKDGTQKYYNDDDNFGTYTIYTSTYTEDTDAETLTFNFYRNSTDLTDVAELTGNLDITDGVLTISGTNEGDLSGGDESENVDVTDAVAAANSEAGVNNVVQILDTNKGGTEEDTGELRIKLADSASVSEILNGRLTVDLAYQEHADTVQEADGSGDNAYISFYAEKTSNSNLHGEVAFENGKIKYRDASGSLTETGDTFELGENLKVEVTWIEDFFSFSINGQTIGDMLPVADGTAVTYISLRLGDNGNTTNFELNADNLKVYSSDSGTEELVLEEDFDSYAPGVNLATVYNSATAEATVISDGETSPETPTGDVTENFDSYTVGTNISDANPSWIEYNTDSNSGQDVAEAVVSDAQANSGSNSLVLIDNHSSTKPIVSREFAAGTSAIGSVSFDVFVPSTNTKTTYVNVGTGKNNSDRFYELRISGSGKVEAETGSDDTEIGAITTDAWNSMSLAWDGDDISVSINGATVDAPKQSETGLDATNTPSHFTFYVGDNSGVDNKAYFDNIDSEQF